MINEIIMRFPWVLHRNIGYNQINQREEKTSRD